MSTISAYFIPTKKYHVGQFKTDVKKALETLKLIDGYYDEEDNTYAHGNMIMFEYASIHDTDKKKLVPEASSSGYGSTCTQCSTDINDEFYDTINNHYDYEEESGEEKDMTELSVKCNNCGKSMKLQEIKFIQTVVLTNHFFQFVDIVGEISQDTLKNIEESLGTELTVIYETM